VIDLIDYGLLSRNFIHHFYRKARGYGNDYDDGYDAECDDDGGFESITELAGQASGGDWALASAHI